MGLRWPLEGVIGDMVAELLRPPTTIELLGSRTLEIKQVGIARIKIADPSGVSQACEGRFGVLFILVWLSVIWSCLLRPESITLPPPTPCSSAQRGGQNHKKTLEIYVKAILGGPER